MASSLISNTVHVLFDSVLTMDDEGIVAIFEALVASGLKGFLGCPTVIYEAALIELFQHGSVRDGMVVSIIQGKTVEITEEVFGGTFELPIDGLKDLNEVQKDLVFYARSIFSFSGEQISVEDVEGVADESRVKKTLMKKDVSKKRLATAVDEHISKKKRTRVGNAAKSSVIVTVAQEAIHMQIGEPIRAVPVVLPSKPKRKAPKRRLKFLAGSDDKFLKKRRLLISTADDVDNIIEQTIAEIAQFETDVGGTNVGETNVGDQAVQRADLMEHWFNVTEIDAVETADGEQTIQRSDEKEKDAESGASEERVVAKQNAEFLCNKPTDEEMMSIDGFLMQISDDMMLPSVSAAEITKIKFGLSVKINEVQDKDWYYASLPTISANDKGKEPLETADVVKGNPAREMVQLICGDEDFLVQQREKVIQEVVDFFHSFSLSQLVDLESVRDVATKEKHMLLWAETNSLETVVKRRVYILVKYREMLLRKFLESHRKYFAPGQPWTAMASQIIDLLSAAHHKSLEALLAQKKEHGLIWEWPCSSSLFDDSVDGGGAVLAQFYSLANSACWLPERAIEDNFVPHCYFIEPDQYWRASQSIIKTWGWFRVCTDIIRYGIFGCLRPVGSVNSCMDIVVKSSVVDIFEKVPTDFCVVLQQGKDTNSFVGYFSDSVVKPALQCLPEVELVSSDGSTVYRSPSPQSLSSSSDQLDFHLSIPMDEEVISTTDVGSTPAVAQLSLPPVVSESFDDLRASISRIIVNQSKESRRKGYSHDEVLVKIKNLERTLFDTLYQQDQDFRSLIQSVRQENHNDTDVLSLSLKAIRAQNAIFSTDLADVRKESKEQKAIIEDMDERLATVRSKFLDFRAQEQENHLNLSTQLGFLVDYINRGGDAKTGEDSSSRPQPPPDDQDRPSGGSASRGSGGDGSSRRRDDRGGSSKKRHRTYHGFSVSRGVDPAGNALGGG
ncbi:embryo-abundant family protein [Dorcoceras hygrometricum]|uniref:Embryo-abundant family protein n=1 Tax=Dorcoceras hygrometricum TaxID=472368 RepID=A0A2Z7CDA0_9LAMI|nr:embryo-abundant family protein [Dorcoceras hygrometricum]